MALTKVSDEMLETPGGGGEVSTSGTPATEDYARFTDASTIEGRTAAQVKSDIAIALADVTDSGALAAEDDVSATGAALPTSGTVELDFSQPVDLIYPELTATDAVTFTVGATPRDGARVVVPFVPHANGVSFGSGFVPIGFRTGDFSFHNFVAGAAYTLEIVHSDGQALVTTSPIQAPEIANNAISVEKLDAEATNYLRRHIDGRAFTDVTVLWSARHSGRTETSGRISTLEDVTSAGRDLSETATSGPTYTADAFKDEPGITFDGVDDQLDSAVNLSEFVAADNYFVRAKFKADAIDPAATNVWENPAIVADDGFWGLHIFNDGGQDSVVGYHWDGSAKTISLPITAGQVYTVEFWYDGTNLNLRLDDGDPATPVAAGAITDLSNIIHMGVGSLAFLTGVVFDVELSNAQPKTLKSLASADPKNSVEIDAGDAQLVNDQASPGANQVYGTDGGGVKGWKADPAGGSGTAFTVAEDTADYGGVNAPFEVASDGAAKNESRRFTGAQGASPQINFTQANISPGDYGQFINETGSDFTLHPDTGVEINGGTADITFFAGETFGWWAQANGTTLEIFTTIGPVNFNDRELAQPELKDYAETRPTPSSSAGTLTIDMEQGNVVETTLTENTTIAITNPPASGKIGSVTIIVHQDATGGWTLSFPSGTVWDGGSAPTMSSAANATDIFTLMTPDAGTTWYGFIGGQAFA